MEKKNILIIEDEPEIAQTIKEKLEMNGYHCVIAQDGKEAHDQMQSTKFSLLLLDLVMPRMDGFTFLEKYKKEYPPIFVLTNLSDEASEEKALKLGANKYIIKSNTSIESILEEVNAYIA